MNRVYDARSCHLGEGALWHPERGQFFWFDILEGKLLSRRGEATYEWQFEEMVSAAGWVDRNRLLIASETELFTFDVESGETAHVVPLEADDMTTRSNDGRADPWGGFWIGTMSKSGEREAGAIYRLYSGQIRRIYTGISIPNALSFALDGSLAYFADSPTRQVMAQPLGPEGWPEGAPRVLIDLRPEGLVPDGAVVDAEGNLWIAQWNSGRVAAYSPEGKFLRAAPVGARRCTCPAFGGPELDTLFVTSAREGMDAAMLAADPLAGQCFQADPGVRGRAEPRVRL